MSGQHSESYGLVLGSPVRSRELESMILTGPFQLEIFYDSMIRVPRSTGDGQPKKGSHNWPSKFLFSSASKYCAEYIDS